jgi:NAD(P)-dependent dehydrogenase (short-subunit alcohol dehydrogenase family)
MIARGAGKILVIGSAAALRGIRRTSTYSAARGAQLAYVQAVGVELAHHKIQVNAIAQNFVDNPTFFPEEVQRNPRFQERLEREVPPGPPRVGTRGCRDRRLPLQRCSQLLCRASLPHLRRLGCPIGRCRCFALPIENRRLSCSPTHGR